MEFLPLSFIAGILTILAPCVLPLLPVIIGGSLQDTKDRWRPVIITVSLAVSLVVFSLILKGTTTALDIDQDALVFISGSIIIFFGVITLFPRLWEKIEVKLRLSTKSNELLAESGKKKGFVGSVLTGFALGPVFASCSPTYALIVSVVLVEDLAVGILNLIVYSFALAAVLLLVALLGQNFINKAKWASNPDGWFKKSLGILFIVVGVAIIFGIDKQIETWLLDIGVYDGIANIEGDLIERVQDE